MAVLICILLNALDGFDVLAVSFASPGIAAEWSINKAELGVVLAMELVGMAFGSILLGGLADRVGRAPDDPAVPGAYDCGHVSRLGLAIGGPAACRQVRDGLGHWRHAGLDKRNGGRVRECQVSQPGGYLDGGRLSAGGDCGGIVCLCLARTLGLARGFRVWRYLHGRIHLVRVVLAA